MSSSSPNQQHLQDDIAAELALWKLLALDMPFPTENHHGDQGLSNDDSSRPQLHIQVPHSAPPSFPPETYNYLIHALLSLQGSSSHPYPQNYPPTYPYPMHSTLFPDYHSPWPSATAPPVSSPSIAGLASFYQTNPAMSIPLLTGPHSAGPSQLTPSPTTSPTTPPTAQDQEGAEDATSMDDEKRRRNTAASARFRVKKKIKTLNLERTIGDLTGRTEELEREATDLRRENAWLKEIVLLKGRKFAGLNLGSQAPVLGNRHDEDENDDRTSGESEPESTAKRKGKGKDKES